MDNRESRICVGCKHLVIEPEMRSYSEYTPGSIAKIYCDLDYWEEKSRELSEFADNMTKAGECLDFELAEDLRLEFLRAERLAADDS